MTASSEAPRHLVEQTERLLETASRLSGVDEELSTFTGRLQRGDVIALRVGLRRVTEAIFRHIARVEKALDDDQRARAELRELRDQTRRFLKGRVSDDFENHLELLQRLANVSAHWRIDDVYKVADLRESNPWPSIQAGLSALEHVIEEFQRLYPPPAPVVEEPVPEANAPDPVREAPPPMRGQQRARRSNATPVPPDADLGEWTVGRVDGDPAVRDRLTQLTGWTRTKVSRRLNSARRNTLLRNLFPGVFKPAAVTIEEPDSEGAFSFEAIGECTLRMVRDLELQEDIARITGLTERAVESRMRQWKGNALVRRVFPEWYDAETIARVTVRTALDYQMQAVLARHLGKRASKIDEMLRTVPGQTKLGNVLSLQSS